METTKIGSPILLKLRFLASRLGVPVLEDWVKHEIEGYPDDAPVPEYRKVGIAFTGTFQNMCSKLSARHSDLECSDRKICAGPNWTTIGIRDSIAVVDDRITRKGEKGGMFGINTGNLPFLLQNKIYKDTAVLMVAGKFDISAFVAIQAAVRAKVLDLTLEIEKAVPAAADIVVGVKPAPLAPSDAEKVAQVAQQVFYGPVTQITNSGTTGPIIVSSAAGDIAELIKALTHVGIPEDDAKELAEIVKAEAPENPREPLGKEAKAWIANKVKAASGIAGKVGFDVITEVIKKAVESYYGLS